MSKEYVVRGNHGTYLVNDSYDPSEYDLGYTQAQHNDSKRANREILDEETDITLKYDGNVEDRDE